MNFQNLSAMLWLIPLAGIIILLYLLRMRRKELRVPAIFLWPERTDEVRANALFQKLKFSWLLILQLAALSLLIMALAKPQTRQTGLAGAVTVIVLDSSASMGATDVKPSRFEQARQIALETIQSASASDRVALIEAGPAPKVIFPLSSDPAKQTLALQAVQRIDAEADMGEALRLAAALVGGLDGARIVVLSDGVFEPVKDFAPGKASLIYRQIGEKAENLAIAALGGADTPAGRQVYVAVRNHGLNARKASLSLLADGRHFHAASFEVPSGKSWGQTVVGPKDAKVIEAKLSTTDYLEADNYAVTLIGQSAQLRVLLISKGNLFLERALALDPRVTLDKAASLPSTETPQIKTPSKYDMVVFDDLPEQAVKARGVLTLGKAGPPSPVVAGGSANKPVFLSTEQSPLTKGVDFQEVYIDQIEKVQLKPVGEVLAETRQGPLLVSAQSPAKRQLYLAFSPLESDFPLQVSFPIFVANALDFLADEASAQVLAIRAGQAFSLPPKAEQAKLTKPDGKTQAIVKVAEGLIVREARHVGRYTLDYAGEKKALYATLRSEVESKIEPAQQLALGNTSAKAVRSQERFADFWRPLLLLVLLVLATEWWMYARRS